MPPTDGVTEAMTVNHGTASAGSEADVSHEDKQEECHGSQKADVRVVNSEMTEADMRSELLTDT